MKAFLPTGIVLLGLALALSVAPAATAPANADGIKGKVVETMNAGGYTYVLIDSGASKAWAAAPQFAVKIGDSVVVTEAMPMKGYHSKTLNRTFEVVYFSGNVAVNGRRTGDVSATTALPQGHPPTGVTPAAAGPDLSGINRAAEGQTVAEIYAGKAKLAGKRIAVRGRVVKFNGGILGKNWLHIRDGSGAEGTNDLTLTTAATAKIGDLVLVTGVLATDRDFGGGYKYGLIVEEATVVVE